MSQSRCLRGASLLAIAFALSTGANAWSQNANSGSDDVIVVTGSHIRGTPETASLPVDVITADELEAQGNPSLVDLIKSIPSSGSVYGETNQFTAGQSTGTGNVNLRNLGAPRTLVMLNGRRLVVGPALDGGVDTNLLPFAAIGRVEVLKDGAAATYGSDAIGGVVNFITRTDLDGLEVRGNFSAIDGSNGDYDLGANWGWSGNRGNALVSAGYRHRSELDVLERDFAHRDFTDFDPVAIGGWSSFSSPGPYSPSFLLTDRFLDPACDEVGGFQSAATTCRFQFAAFDNLVEDEDHYQVFGQFNYDLTESITFHAEALWAAHYVEAEGSSPSYGPVQGPGIIANGTFFPALANHFVIPETNPGLTANFISLLPASTQAYLATPGTQNLYTLGLLWRPLAQGGNALFDSGSKEDQRNFDGMHISAGLEGDFGNGVEWDLAVTWGRNESDISTSDIVVSHLGYALRGLGGDNCDTDPVTPGVQGTPGAGGCLWFNPFSTGIAGNPATGDVNGLTYDAATDNSRDVLDYLFEDYAYGVTTEQLVIDFVMNGESGIELAGGNVGWALGAQYRDQSASRWVSDISNIDLNPCVDLGDTSCTNQNGALSFFGPLANYDLSGENYAIFGEVLVPFTDDFEAQLAVRFEDYGDRGGTTTNPKLSMRWQVTDALALRGSAGSTFRAPPLTQTDPNYNTLLAFTSAVTGYRAYDTYGNPDLQPETAVTFNLGAIIDAGPFSATIDYFSYDFEDPIMTEGGTRMATALFVTNGNSCGDPAYADLEARFTFNGGVCSPGNMLRARVNTVNGPSLSISGFDTMFELDLGEMFGRDSDTFIAGTNFTYVDEWSQDDFYVEGILVREAADYAGTYDHNGNDSQPELKGSAWIEYVGDSLRLRWTTRYVGEMEDLRPIAANHETKVIDAFLTHDVTAVWNLTDSTTLTGGVMNIFNEDPPFAGTDLGYDPFTASPLGRVFRVGASHRF